MNVFELRERLINDYSSYIRSFIRIRDERVTNDPNPSAKDELGEKFDPDFLAMNSTRGKALEAVVAYAWWVRRCTDAERKAAGQTPVTFEAMPEVRQVLDDHLEVAKEPTLAIRSVYGRLLTSIAILDLDWLQTSVDRILPSGQNDPPRFNAAWESFIGFNQPHPRLLSVLMSAYQRAVRQIADTSQTKRRGVSPEDRLAEHLMVYYWLGKLDVGGRMDFWTDSMVWPQTDFGAMRRGSSVRVFPNGMMRHRPRSSNGFANCFSDGWRSPSRRPRPSHSPRNCPTSDSGSLQRNLMNAGVLKLFLRRFS